MEPKGTLNPSVASNSLKLPDSEHIEQVPSSATSASERRLIRKIDLHVLPLLCLLYAFSLIDRSIISAAKVVGMAKDLHLTGNRYNVALLGSLATEVPATVEFYDEITLTARV